MLVGKMASDSIKIGKYRIILTSSLLVVLVINPGLLTTGLASRHRELFRQHDLCDLCVPAHLLQKVRLSKKAEWLDLFELWQIVTAPGGRLRRPRRAPT